MCGMARKHPVNAEMDECLLLVPEVIVLDSRLAVALPLQPESADAGKARPCGAMLSGQVKQDELKRRHGMAWHGSTLMLLGNAKLVPPRRPEGWAFICRRANVKAPIGSAIRESRRVCRV